MIDRQGKHFTRYLEWLLGLLRFAFPSNAPNENPQFKATDKQTRFIYFSFYLREFLSHLNDLCDYRHSASGTSQWMWWKKLKIIKVFGNQCNICREKPHGEMVATNCGHLFCIECLEKWFCTLLVNGSLLRSCPTCQSIIRKPYTRKSELRSELRNVERDLRLIRSKHRRIKRRLNRLH